MKASDSCKIQVLNIRDINMSQSEIIFKITESKQCPCYKNDDEFKLSGNALDLKLDNEKIFITSAVIKPPPAKETCRILISDLNRILIEHESVDKIPVKDYSCSGCSGLIKVEPQFRSKTPIASKTQNNFQHADIKTDILSNFSIFQSLDRRSLRDIISLLKQKKFNEGDIVLNKGAPAQNLYIILSGAVDVLDEKGGRLSTLKRGDVFGEMSLISGDSVGATIKVVKPAKIIFMKGKDFRNVLNKFPSIQMYLARLLAQRLAKSNVVRAEEISSGMIGSLSELPPDELVQTLNLNQKTGKLTFTLPSGSAELAFRRGELVTAVYNEKVGKEAFYDVIKEKEGQFKFHSKLSASDMNAPVMGSITEMLLEGLRKIDEENSSNSWSTLAKG